jgi:hypothetical protein
LNLISADLEKNFIFFIILQTLRLMQAVRAQNIRLVANAYMLSVAAMKGFTARRCPSVVTATAPL